MKRLLLILVGAWLGLSCGTNQTRSSPYPQMTLSGEETWTIDAVDYHIAETILIIYPGQQHLFSVIVHVDKIEGESQRDIAIKIAKHALERGYLYQTLRVRRSGEPVSVGPWIGIALVESNNLGVSKLSHGYRFQFSIEELNEPLPIDTVQSNTEILGSWKSQTGQTMHFKGDGTLSTTYESETRTGRYYIDWNQEPSWIDVQWENGERLRSLIRKTDNTQLDMTLGIPGRGRPRDFSGPVATFTPMGERPQ